MAGHARKPGKRQVAVWLRVPIARLVANGDSPTVVSYNKISELISKALPLMIRGWAVTEDD
jgi:hypothetical protein